MKTLFFAELYKVLKNKLTYVAIGLATIPLIISACFIYAKESFSLGNGSSVPKINVFDYTINISLGMIFQIFIYILFLVLYINSFISDEVKTDKILYQVVGSEHRKNTFINKIMVTVFVSLVFLGLTMLSAYLGFELFIVDSEYFSNKNTFDSTQLFLLCFQFLYFICFMIFVACLSFVKKGNIVLIATFVVNLLSLNLAGKEKIALFIPGALSYNSNLLSQGNIVGVGIFQVIYLVAITGVIAFMAYRNFQKREF